MAIKIIFDFGANEGQNLSYYLKKADLVVAVEANPALAKKIKNDFKDQVEDKSLLVLNNCLVGEKTSDVVNFYCHKTDGGLSSFKEPKTSLSSYDLIKVEPITYQEIVAKVGIPFYVKIDLEGLDFIIFDSIIKSKILPYYLSFENSVTYTEEILKNTQDYQSFNFVSFYNYSKIYGKTEDKTAGPFGLDIKSPWLNQKAIITMYKKMPSTWFDIHLCREDQMNDLIDEGFYKMDFDVILSLKQFTQKVLRKITSN